METTDAIMGKELVQEEPSDNIEEAYRGSFLFNIVNQMYGTFLLF